MGQAFSCEPPHPAVIRFEPPGRGRYGHRNAWVRPRLRTPIEFTPYYQAAPPMHPHSVLPSVNVQRQENTSVAAPPASPAVVPRLPTLPAFPVEQNRNATPTAALPNSQTVNTQERNPETQQNEWRQAQASTVGDPRNPPTSSTSKPIKQVRFGINAERIKEPPPSPNTRAKGPNQRPANMPSPNRSGIQTRSTWATNDGQRQPGRPAQSNRQETATRRNSNRQSSSQPNSNDRPRRGSDSRREGNDTSPRREPSTTRSQHQPDSSGRSSDQIRVRMPAVSPAQSQSRRGNSSQLNVQTRSPAANTLFDANGFVYSAVTDSMNPSQTQERIFTRRFPDRNEKNEDSASRQSAPKERNSSQAQATQKGKGGVMNARKSAPAGFEVGPDESDDSSDETTSSLSDHERRQGRRRDSSESAGWNEGPSKRSRNVAAAGGPLHRSDGAILEKPSGRRGHANATPFSDSESSQGTKDAWRKRFWHGDYNVKPPQRKPQRPPPPSSPHSPDSRFRSRSRSRSNPWDSRRSVPEEEPVSRYYFGIVDDLNARRNQESARRAEESEAKKARKMVNPHTPSYSEREWRPIYQGDSPSFDNRVDIGRAKRHRPDVTSPLSSKSRARPHPSPMMERAGNTPSTSPSPLKSALKKPTPAGGLAPKTKPQKGETPFRAKNKGPRPRITPVLEGILDEENEW